LLQTYLLYMKLTRTQWITIGTALLAVIVVYLFANNRKPKEPMAANPAAEMAKQQAEALDIEEYIADTKGKITDKAVAQKLDAFEQGALYDSIIGVYRSIDKPLAVAYYAIKKAEKTNATEDWLNAGDFNEAMMQSAPDEKSRTYLSTNAVASYQNALQKDSANLTIQMKLASAYINDGSNPMQGIGILRGIVEKDSNNADAQLLLGKYAIISGQNEKAIARLEKVVYLQPSNTEGLLLLAQAYEGAGNKAKAIEALERSLKTEKEPGFQASVKDYIKKLKGN
jgi:tetratricopeptide (TPR) repeat protein